MIKMKISLLFLIALMFSCSTEQTVERTPTLLKIGGPMKNSDEEISGMDWYNDNLILLPENLNGYVFAIKKAELDSRINGNDTTTIFPEQIKLNTPNYKELVPGFDSFEAIAFRGYEVYLTIEIRFADSMSCLLARGHIDEETLDITVPEQNLTVINVPTYIDNMSYESLVIEEDRVIALFEANGDSLLRAPYAVSINSSGNDIIKYPLSSINYRITDATSVDKKNRFWVINYFFPRDKKTLKPSNDTLSSKYGNGPSHSKSSRIERLVEYEIKNKQVLLTKSAPIEIELFGENISRKWEALARYGNKGFLIATDKYPKPYTLLAFLPHPSYKYLPKVSQSSSTKYLKELDARLSKGQASKYLGSHSGNWEGYLLNQYNNGSAQFSVRSDGRATLTLSGKFSATHQGRVEGKYFITNKGKRCSIVELGGGQFKIVLIWEGVNLDVYFQ